MASIRQHFKNVGEKWLYGLEKEPESKIDDKTGIYVPEYTPPTVKKLTKADLRAGALNDPMVWKAIRKSSRDTFREGWTITHRDPEQEVDPIDLKIIDDFNKKSQIKKHFQSADICKYVYGDGFLEIIYQEPETNTIDMEVPPKAEPKGFRVLNSEYITKKEKKTKDDPAEYYIYRKPGQQKKWMHPDRIIHIPNNPLPNSEFGISSIHSLYSILLSKFTLNEDCGEIIHWAGKGKTDVKIDPINKDKQKLVAKSLKEGVNAYIHGPDYEYNILNPETMDIKPYAEYLHTNIAAEFEMPQHILTGVQPGQLKGSELGVADYYKSIESNRELEYTPVFENRIYNRLLESHGRSFDNYRIKWNQTYIDEQAESLNLKTRTEAAKLAMELFVIDEQEFRDIMREGITDSFGKNILKEEEEGEEEEAPPEKKEEAKIVKVPLTDKQKEMIRLERKLGEKEISEQEKRVKDAKKKVKK